MNRALTIAGWLGTVVVALVVGRFAAIDPRWDGLLVRAVAAALVCILVYAAARRRSTAHAPVVSARHPQLSIATLASAVAVVLALNVIAERYRLRWDLTSAGLYQLSPETRAVLRSLDAPIRIHLSPEQARRPADRDRLKEYSQASGLVMIEQADGEPRVEYKGRVERIDPASEQEFTNALIRLREGRARKVYFTFGHAERDIFSTERVGYSTIAARLQRQNFAVERMNLAQIGEVPADATIVVVAGPRADFFRAETDALQRYVDKGGALLVMVDPFEDLKRYITESGNVLFMMDPSSAFSTGGLKNLTTFAREQGAEFGNDVVVDASGMGQFLNTDASVPVVAHYPAHAITRDLTALSAYPMARSVSARHAAGKAVASIIETGDKTWSETDIQQLAAGRLSMDAASGDRPGPVSLGVALSSPAASTGSGNTAPPREMRLVAVGDSDFVANYSANIPGNADIFLSIVHWLAQDRVVTIAPRRPYERLLTMSGAQRQVLSWFAILVLPGAALGLAAFLRKKNRV
jgi:ABC-type uncharacterized transport system involved in gliding motility auxiliary subunit